MRLEDRVAIVTGGGRGIGAAIVRRLADEGAQVAVLDLIPGAAEAVASAVPRGRGYCVDVSDLGALQKIIADVKEVFGRIDILVNNAGITRDRTLRNMDPTEWERVIQVNLTGVWNGCKAALPYLLEAGASGRIVSISSVSYLGNFGQVNYAAAKAAVVGLTRSLALEVAKHGVTVNAIAPGYVSTAMTTAMPPEVLDRVLASIPLRRLARPEEVAALAAFLASDDAAYITGQVLFVCGGYSVGRSPA